MSKRPHNHPAFPVPAYAGDRENQPVRPNTGMSILDYFAASALQGLLAHMGPYDSISEDAYELATEMLVEKENQK
jgi:hypothetical protein